MIADGCAWVVVQTRAPHTLSVHATERGAMAAAQAHANQWGFKDSGAVYHARWVWEGPDGVVEFLRVRRHEVQT